MACLESAEEQIAVLQTYGSVRIAYILGAFMSLMSDGVSESYLHLVKEDINIHALLQVFLLPLDVHIYGYDAPTLFRSEEEWKSVVKIKEERGKSRLDRFRTSRVQESTASAALSMYGYFGRKAYQALRRQYNSQAIDEQEKMDLAAKLYHLYEESGHTCGMCGVSYRLLEGKHFNNPSVDRIRPGVRGGKYGTDNIRLICNGCNGVKHYHTLDEGMLLLHTLAQSVFVVEKTLLCTTALETMEIASRGERDLVRVWIASRLKCTRSSLETRAKKLTCSLEKEDLEELVKERYVGNGKLQCVSGFVGSLLLFSIDRIDSNHGYHKDNVRLLLSGLNKVKADNNDDVEIIAYMEHLHKHRDTIRKRVKPGVRLPLTR
jgi:hypothetical protein